MADDAPATKAVLVSGPAFRAVYRQTGSYVEAQTNRLVIYEIGSNVREGDYTAMWSVNTDLVLQVGTRPC